MGGEHTMQNTDGTLQNYTLETYTIPPTNVTPINSIKKKKKKGDKLHLAYGSAGNQEMSVSQIATEEPQHRLKVEST